MKELKESNQTLQKELQDEKSNHQMTQLRAEKQEEWNRRELAQLKDELADKKKLMDNMISKELYKRDLDNLKIQNQTALVCFICSRKLCSPLPLLQKMSEMESLEIKSPTALSPLIIFFHRLTPCERKTPRKRSLTTKRKSLMKSSHVSGSS